LDCNYSKPESSRWQQLQNHLIHQHAWVGDDNNVRRIMDGTLPSLTDREVVFISHANPEDNEFATWLTLRLTREGYRVWCDVANLMGGDDFWRDIETSIRDHTRKFIYILTRASNRKQGPLQELAIAAGVARQLNEPGFVIPVKLDDLPHSDHNIQIHRLNALTFTAGWQEGLVSLLTTLDDAAVPRPLQNGAAQVASWWNENRLNHDILQRKPESLWTNWFSLKGLPKHIWVWDIPENAKLPDSFPYPTYRMEGRLFSFAEAAALTTDGQTPTGGRGLRIPSQPRRDPAKKTGLKRHQVITAVKQLLRQAWAQMARQHSLPMYDLSSGRQTLWFPKSATGDTIEFEGVNGGRSQRDLCGYKTITKPNGDKYKRYWHFGLEAVPVLYPSPVLALKSHVVFTLDGKHAAGDSKYQHRARRGQCAMWWNDKWRDLTLAAVACLADNGVLSVPVAPSESLVVEPRPIRYSANVGYRDADVRPAPAELISDDEPGDDDELEEPETIEA
jgi:hypothetical protein